MLNQRLQACAAWIADGKTVCDVGTDHAYLAAELLRKERCQHVIASDIGEGPLQTARRTLEQAGLLQRATLLLSDGLEQVDGTDVSHVVIAGMGGETIIHILQPCRLGEAGRAADFTADDKSSGSAAVAGEKRLCNFTRASCKRRKVFL